MYYHKIRNRPQSIPLSCQTSPGASGSGGAGGLVLPLSIRARNWGAAPHCSVWFLPSGLLILTLKIDVADIITTIEMFNK